MALNPPSGFAATAISPTRIDLSWAGGGKYDSIHIERRVKDTPPYVEIDMVDGNEEYYIDESPPLTPEVTYEYKIRGRALYPVEEYSDYTGVKEATTPATLAPPSLCVATAFSDFIEITWKDNSTREDTFRIARNKDGAGWVENFATIPANMDYYRDEAVVAGSVYQYRVLARDEDGPEESAPSNVSTATAQSAPAAPTLLVKSDVEDTSIQLSWTDNATTETGFKIEIGIDVGFGAGKVDRVVGKDVTAFLATGLTPATQYWFRVRAYNGVGNSAYTNVVTDTTLAAGVYTPTEFETWIRNPSIEPVYLAEIYTKMDLAGFAVHDDPCYKKTIGAGDRGIDILEVFEDGDAYTEKANAAEVKANAESFWFDYDNRILYVHATGGVDPAGFLIEGAFWLYFSTHKDIEFTANGRLQHFLPLLAKEDIPNITQGIKPYYEGNFLISSGSIAFMNGKITGEHFFDKKYVNYTWENSKLILKAGKSDFTYANFETILTSLVDEKNCNDNKITLTLRDIRQEMERDLMLTKFALANFPDLEEDFVGEPIPICFGTKFGVTPIPIDVDNRKYKFHDGRSKSVEAVFKNAGAALTEDTDYFIDLQRSIITFERDVFVLGEEDIITVNFTGTVNSADEPISNGAEIFKYLMTASAYYKLLDSELNLDSIYEAKYEKTDLLSIFLYKDTPYREIVNSIEHSMEAFTFQDAQGRLGLRAQLAAAKSDAKYISNHQIFEHRQSRARKLLFWKVNVLYNENTQSQEWEVKSAQDDNIWYRYKNRNELNIYSYFAVPFPAQTLATNIMALLNKETIEDTVPMLLFDTMAGDIVKFSRTRFYNTDGTVAEGSEISLRIIKISKSPASGKTNITAELV